MALRYDLTSIANFRETCFDAVMKDGAPELDSQGQQLYNLKPLTLHMINLTMYIGVGEISAGTAQDFYNRALFYERVFDGPRTSGRESLFISAAEVKLHIGLSTNALRMTKAQFAQHIWKCFEDRPLSQRVMGAELPTSF